MTKTIIILVGIFVAGLITDLLTTKYTQAVGDRKIWYATVLKRIDYICSVWNTSILDYRCF